MSIFKKTDFLTLSDLLALRLENPDYGIYAVNTARIPTNSEEYNGVLRSAPRSEPYEATLHIAIETTDKTRYVTVPVTWIPIALSDLAGAKDIIESASFKQLVNQRLLTLVSQEAYERIMKTSEARDALEYLRSQDLVRTVTIEDSDILADLNRRAASSTGTTKKPTKHEAKPLTAIVHTFCDSESQESHSSLFQQFQSVAHRMTEADLTHLSEKSHVAKIKTDAAKRLKQLEAGSEDSKDNS
jgi:hypothetical protein